MKYRGDSIMVKVLNMFREFSMKDVEGYDELTNEQKDMFDKTYKKHLSSMQRELRLAYTESHVQRIEGEISVLKVYFDNGDCYIYLPEYKWVKVP